MKKFLPYILIIAVLVGFGWWAIMSKMASDIEDSTGFYKNDIYGFAIPLGDDMKVGSFEEGEGTTVLIQSPKYQMQIRITPFDEDILLTLDRVKQDIPDLVMEEGIETKIAGVAAVTFYSEDGGGNRFREVWFIYNFQLYQILAKAERDDLTGKIMENWKWD